MLFKESLSCRKWVTFVFQKPLQKSFIPSSQAVSPFCRCRILAYVFLIISKPHICAFNLETCSQGSLGNVVARFPASATQQDIRWAMVVFHKKGKHPAKSVPFDDQLSNTPFYTNYRNNNNQEHVSTLHGVNIIQMSRCSPFSSTRKEQNSSSLEPYLGALENFLPFKQKTLTLQQSHFFLIMKIKINYKSH